MEVRFLSIETKLAFFAYQTKSKHKTGKPIMQPGLNLWSGHFERFFFHLDLDDALACSQPGRDAEEDCREVLKRPYVLEQLEAVEDSTIREELREYGAWDDDELKDMQEDYLRVIWLAANDIREEYQSRFGD